MFIPSESNLPRFSPLSLFLLLFPLLPTLFSFFFSPSFPLFLLFAAISVGFKSYFESPSPLWENNKNVQLLHFKKYQLNIVQGNWSLWDRLTKEFCYEAQRKKKFQLWSQNMELPLFWVETKNRSRRYQLIPALLPIVSQLLVQPPGGVKPMVPATVSSPVKWECHCSPHLACHAELLWASDDTTNMERPGDPLCPVCQSIASLGFPVQLCLAQLTPMEPPGCKAQVSLHTCSHNLHNQAAPRLTGQHVGMPLVSAFFVLLWPSYHSSLSVQTISVTSPGISCYWPLSSPSLLLFHLGLALEMVWPHLVVTNWFLLHLPPSFILGAQNKSLFGVRWIGPGSGPSRCDSLQLKSIMEFYVPHQWLV